MRLATDRSRQTHSLLALAPPQDWQSRRLARRTDQLRPVPLGSMVLDAFGALGIAARAASLQGFNPSAGWGAPSPDFSTCGVPGSHGLHPPWGIPLPSLGLTVVELGLTTATTTPRNVLAKRRRNVLGLLSARREVPCWAPYPLLQVSKSKEVGLPLSRLPAP
jgi:hypothetical protein